MSRVKKRGFTLIELMMVITVATVISTLVVSAFRNYERVQRFQGSVADVRNGLAEARIKTLGSLNNSVHGVYVGTSTIQFFQGTTPIVGSSSNTIITFPSGITATSSFSNSLWYVTFGRITGAPTAIGTITITDSVSNTSKIFTISATGLVQ